MRPSFALLTCLFITLSGCADDSVSETVPPVKSAAETAVSTPPESAASSSTVETVSGERTDIDGLGFKVPAGWSKVPLSPFQTGIISAKFAMPDVGPDVTLTLSRSGGSIDDNLDRWRGQVEASRSEISETVSVAGVESRWIDLEGRFSAGFGRPPEDGWRMIGVIVPLSDQGYFLKLTGPVDQVAGVEEAFREFLKSAARS